MSRRKPVFLIAGDPGSRRTGPDPLLRTVFDNCGVASPSIAYVGAASTDDQGFFDWACRMFTKSGSGKVTLAPTVRRFERRSFEKTCEGAEAVYISGGDVEEGNEGCGQAPPRSFLERPVSRRQADLWGFGRQHHAGPRLGALEDEDDSVGRLFLCLGIADILCDTHGERERWGELRTLLRLAPDSSIGYGIRAGSAIRVDPDGTVEPMGKIDRFVRQGEVVRRA